jgi:hypothetical protein
MLDLYFESSGERTQRTGLRTFRLYERDGWYALPDVTLRPEPGGQPQAELHDVAVSDIKASVREAVGLSTAVAQAWRPDARPGAWVAGPQDLAVRRRLLVSHLDKAFQVAAGAPVKVWATWSYGYTGADRIPGGTQHDVTLEFMPPGTPVPPPPDFPPAPAPLGSHPALREIEGRRDFAGFAAVDFGTSSSTVTLYDARHHAGMVLDPGQAHRLRTGLADLLRHGPAAAGYPDLAASWQAQLPGLASRLADFDATLAGLDMATLQSLLRGSTLMAEGRDLLLDAVCRQVETLLQADPELFKWLAPALLKVYDDAFKVPPLEEMFLRQVVLDQNSGELELDSAVSVQSGHPVSIELGSRVQGVPGGSIRNLKSRLLKLEEYEDWTNIRNYTATSDDLIALVYLQLAGKAEEFGHGEREGEPEVLRSLVVTYPTTTPPAVRSRLRDLVRTSLQLDTVVTDFDEGVAAGLFFLLRDFSSNRREFGTEGLRARSRRVADEPPTWQQNMLVLDMGAGTTDIALITLTLIDMTESIAGVAEAVQGRYYVIRPELRNSTGDPQLGGDYLTLRVFYWLKAKIADALLAGSGATSEREALRQQVLPEDVPGRLPSLATAVVEGGLKEPAPDWVRLALQKILPTDWKNRPDCEPAAFENLWYLAETVKKELGKAGVDTWRIEHWQLADVVNTIPVPVADRSCTPDLLPPQGLELSSADLRKLAYPVLAQAVNLAGWITRQSLKDEPLDRVMLTGKSSKMPQMREVVVANLGAGADDTEAALSWNAAAVTVEAEYAKTAASIGACWAQSLRNRSMSQKAAQPDMSRGRTQIMIDIDNLTHTLPCSFRLQLQEADDRELLRAGTRLTEIDSGGTVGVRTEKWEEIIREFQVNRPQDEHQSIQWGVFHFERHANRDGFTPSDVWYPGRDGNPPARVKVQLEVTQDLVPHLHIVQGRPHYLVPIGAPLDLRKELGPESLDEAKRELRKLPAEIWVTGLSDRAHPDGEELLLFPRWEPGLEEDPREWFTEFFRDNPDPNLKERIGRVSAPLPPPEPNGQYQISLRWPDGQVKKFPLLVRGPRGATARYVATLDQHGGLTIHRGNPPYWRAESPSLVSVQDHPGMVFRVKMDDGVPNFKESWNPFTGKH